MSVKRGISLETYLLCEMSAKKCTLYKSCPLNEVSAKIAQTASL